MALNIAPCPRSQHTNGLLPPIGGALGSPGMRHVQSRMEDSATVDLWRLAPPQFAEFSPSRQQHRKSAGTSPSAATMSPASPLRDNVASLVAPDPIDPAIVSVNGPVRPWGKRAKEVPLTRHTPSSFQKSRQGYGGAIPGV